MDPIIDLDATIARWNDEAKDNLEQAEKLLAELDEKRAKVIDVIAYFKRRIADANAKDAQRRANAVGSIDSVIKVLEANRGRKMSAREIVDAAGTDLRVRYLVMRHVGKPKIHESGSTKGKVYWID